MVIGVIERTGHGGDIKALQGLIKRKPRSVGDPLEVMSLSKSFTPCISPITPAKTIRMKRSVSKIWVNLPKGK